MAVKTLPSGHLMPVIGLGTWVAAGEILESAVTKALDSGYRHIDTAYSYYNEDAIGNAVKKWIEDGSGTREELFITTKLPPFGNKPEEVEVYLEKSLKRLQLDYVDMYLINMPFGFLNRPTRTNPPVLDESTDVVAVWKAMEAQVKLGRVRSLGVSNFNASQIQRLAAADKTVPISNVQVELHALLQQPKLREFCQRLGIVVTAFAPLGSPTASVYIEDVFGVELSVSEHPLENETVLAIAERVEASPAQVLIKFLLELGLVVIPKSANHERVVENIKAQDVELSKEDVEELKAQDIGDSSRVFDFLYWTGVENHPEYPFTISR